MTVRHYFMYRHVSIMNVNLKCINRQINKVTDHLNHTNRHDKYIECQSQPYKWRKIQTEYLTHLYK